MKLQEIRCKNDGTLLVEVERVAGGGVKLHTQRALRSVMELRPTPDGKHNLMYFICTLCNSEVFLGSMPRPQSPESSSPGTK
jgi:hypothetical protein